MLVGRFRCLDGSDMSEKIKRLVTSQLKKIPSKRLLRLREYEMTGDAILLDRPRPEEGAIIKVVKHEDKFMLIAEVYGEGYSEEYYVGEIVY